MPRYEFKQGTSSKFWEIEVDGSSYTTTFGKIGSEGKASTKDFDSAEKAEKEAEKQIASKVKKGYVLVGGAAGADGEDGASGGGTAEGIVGLEKESTDNFEEAKKFVFRRVIDYKPKPGLSQAKQGAAYRVTLNYDDDESFSEQLDALLGDPQLGELQALVIGAWAEESDESSGHVIGRLLEQAQQMPQLTALFLGDIVQEQNEISWIEHGDWAPLLTRAFPQLKYFRVRGGAPELSELSNESLRALQVQSGGFAGSAIEAIGQAHFPNLEHLEIWIGSDNYGAPNDADCLAPILSGKAFPKLKYLGLRNAEIADAAAQAVATSPLLERLEALDLSMGTLGDAGAEALLASPALKKLQRLDLHHNFLTDAMRKKLKGVGIPQLDVRQGDADVDEDPEYRYCQISE